MFGFRRDAALADARERIIALASEFADVSQQALESALRRATEELVADHAAWFNAFDDETARALRRAIDEATRASAHEIAIELRDPDLWFSPTVAVNPHAQDLSGSVADPVDPVMPASSVDNPFNRVWVHLSNGADHLDGILDEFALEPSVIADWGGGHYGLQPKTIEELDPGGRLVELWDRYRKAFDRYRRLARRAGTKADDAAREEAIRRWRAEGVSD